MKITIPNGVALLVIAVMVGCGKPPEDPKMLAACHGSKLSLEDRAAAQEEGYQIHHDYLCITKESFAWHQEEKERFEANNTPEAKAEREREFAERVAKDNEQRAGREKERERQQEAERATLLAEMNQPIELVDINLASESDLVRILGDGLAQQVIEERSKRPFTDWGDLISRIVAFKGASVSYRASQKGLTVNGEDLLKAAR